MEARGQLVEATRLYQECERIFRSLGDPGSIALALSHQAAILVQVGSPSEALALAEQAHALVVKHELSALNRQLEDKIAAIRALI